MKRFLAYWGYSNQRTKDVKATYLITSLSLLIMILYSSVYLIVFENKFVGIFSSITTLSFILVLYLLKRNRELAGKLIMVISLLIQTFSVSVFFFNRDSGMNYFFFLFIPAAFIVFNYQLSKERIIIILIDILAAIFLVVSEVFEVDSIIHMSVTALTFMRVTSILVTIGLIIFVYNFYFSDLAIIHENLKKSANTDALTGVANRRELDIISKRFFKNGSSRRFAILILDIDFFKLVNDTYGHPAGDAVLIQLAKLISINIRAQDIITRTGGEEFIVILDSVEPKHVLQITENIRKLVENEDFTLPDGTTIKITISIGAKCYSDYLVNVDEMIEAADKALYTAKRNGRNQVVIHR